MRLTSPGLPYVHSVIQDIRFWNTTPSNSFKINPVSVSNIVDFKPNEWLPHTVHIKDVREFIIRKKKPYIGIIYFPLYRYYILSII